MEARNEVLVLGAGLAGLTAAWQASARGKKVRLISKGWGATHWHAGCVDVLGYWPVEAEQSVKNPGREIAQLLEANPDHPYGHIELEKLSEALQALQSLCAAAGYPLEGSLDKNWRLPSTVGTARPTCLAPATMIAGDLESKEPMLLVGFKQFVDFYPKVAADNLSELGIPARDVVLDLPELAQRHGTTGVVLAQMMEQAMFQAQVVKAIQPHLGDAARVGFPAVLGTQQASAVHRALQEQLERPVFEIPGLPPSVPGIRLHHILKHAIERNGGRVFDGMEAVGAETQNGQVTAIYTETAARNRAHRYQQYVLATGGILGGGITADHDGQVREVIFDLPLDIPKSQLDWFQRDFMDPEGHPIYRSGVVVDKSLRPIDGDKQVLYENLYAAGTTLAGCEAIRERSFDGVALATGYAVGNLVGG
jgi:glycerol-3-phosphate dehydrogenase subunit B